MKTTIARYVNNGTQTVAANANILFANNTFSNCALGYDNLGGIQTKNLVLMQFMLASWALLLKRIQ